MSNPAIIEHPQSFGQVADTIEVTPEMLDAGAQTFYENAVGGWETPGAKELRNLLREIYAAMARCAPRSSCPI
jgi:hypothetical protein